MSAFPPQSPPASKSLPIYQVGLLLSLYVAQGLPVGFLTQALPAILRQNHVSLAAIGGFGLLMAPWALKFLWAPIVDRYFSAQWGQSRSWIIPTQLVTVMLLLLIALLLKAAGSRAQGTPTPAPAPRDPDYQQVSVAVPRAVSLLSDVASVLFSHDSDGKSKVDALVERRRARSEKREQSIDFSVPRNKLTRVLGLVD